MTQGLRTMLERIRDLLLGPSRRVREAERRLEEAVRRKKIVTRPRALVKETA